ncbi:Protein of unknown function DUF91 [Candidatus Kryptobacter tengchongensis]|nr:Protein of unknown function DUF91 [Candidatus Kryptobacter tengchongensis]
MGLSEEQIGKLLEWFVKMSETRKRLSEQRRRALEENNKWIQPDVIRRMSDEELERRFIEYYKSGGGRQSLNQINRDRIIRDKKRFRETILYLLDEDIEIKERIEQILGGKYHIEGFGRGILTSFLIDYKPEKYCLWNNKTDMGFSVIGWKVYESKDLWGSAYLKVLEALQRIKDIRPDLNLSFLDIDLFLHTISAEEEGMRAVKAVTEGLDFNLVESKGEISVVTESMEFAMEKYLEEFIEANFNKIFGANLELYQDEESTGRQYPTPIGNIDLLAVDREKKEFVVIELKKGRSSDVVVGQILRYMGWVKENIAKDYNVRGIIILKERDEKLEYALKLIPNVSLFLYEVSFSLKKIY